MAEPSPSSAEERPAATERHNSFPDTNSIRLPLSDPSLPHLPPHSNSDLKGDSTNGTAIGAGEASAAAGGSERKSALSPSRPSSSRRDAQHGGTTHPLAKSARIDSQADPTNLSPQQRPSSVAGALTPTRRSVQFARGASDNEAQGEGHSRASSFGQLDGDQLAKDRRAHQSLLSKLKAFAASPSFQGHTRDPSGGTGGSGGKSPVENATPRSERADYRFPWIHDDGSDADADAESSSGEQKTGLRKKLKTRIRSSQPGSGVQTAPPSPKQTERPALPSSSSPINRSDDYTTHRFRQRPMSSVLSLNAREGVSEDEGRDRLNRDRMWRRRSGWLQSTRNGHSEEPLSQGAGHLRRLTGLAGPSDPSESIGAAWRRHKAERGTSLSAQRWRQIKAGLKMIGQRRKAESTVDHVKSAELLAELTSGVPAALLLASMFQRDEHGSKRIPILLEQLKVRVTDSQFDHNSGDRHLVFRIELEYGNGMTRMKWLIHRTLRDFANLHLKYKLHIGTQKYIQLKGGDSGSTLPRFPRGAFPYLRGVRGLESDTEDEEDEAGDETAGEASGNERSNKKKKRRSFGAASRRQSSFATEEGVSTAGIEEQVAQGVPRRDPYPERQRKKLESYLQKMIRFLIFRPDSNRLCKFLELSALGVRLAAEGSYHGKEGFLMIQSSKGLDFRRALNPTMLKSRHSPKWFLVRHSYVVCVDSPEGMHIYDVFLVDRYFQLQEHKARLRDQNPKEIAKSAKDSATHPQQHHTLRLQNSERKLRLLARNERQLIQFEESIRFMIENTAWAKPNRFDSFAPVRTHCFAQWMVDGRDYMWVVSRAINQAKDVIYIHDWWLSPELYMRRPAAISQKWRLDRLLQRKAREGVKVFVIMYRNINTAIPIDSEYSKFSLLDLHPNIFVQRSPNQFRQNTFFWAHHEKFLIVDHTLAFVGGIDLCFGRWDTPQHTLTDDKPTGFETTDGPKDSDHCQLWPGKDYSNPRIQDFYELDKPYEEMYDRNVVPRVPWHDIAMHIVGQPARDLTRHFVQRWNYILRQRRPTRPTPFLLPPPDFNPADLEALGLDGTCEVQMLRSSSMWSTGTPDVTEHSIMNAYVKMIEQSEHFIYIENQFFVSTCEIEGKKVENLIGDALVERIERAARNDEDWRAVILIPLMPGFQNTVDAENGTSLRRIMQCQYRSICRGESSIFGRLRAQGIEPDDFIQYFSLRNWGKIGPRKHLVTEQVYIHAKCMIADDRVAIIGSANINERSMLGYRDSECAAMVRDTDMVWSSMNGVPYLVGRFPHTLRMRLMREHIGIDVDEVLEEEITAEAGSRKSQGADAEGNVDTVNDAADSPSSPAKRREENGYQEQQHRLQDEYLMKTEDIYSFNHDVDWEQADNPNLKSSRKPTADSRVTRNISHRKDLAGHGVDQMSVLTEAGRSDGRDTYISSENAELLVSNERATRPETVKRSVSLQNSEREQCHKHDGDRPSSGGNAARPGSAPKDASHSKNGGGAEDSRSNPHIVLEPPEGGHPRVPDVRRPSIDKYCMKDPLDDAFYLDIWQKIAENNTKLYRTVFRCMPDSEIKTWKDYKEYTAYAERFADKQNKHYYNAEAPHLIVNKGSIPNSGPPGAGTAATATKIGEGIGKAGNDIKEKVVNQVSSNGGEDEALKQWASEANKAQTERNASEEADDTEKPSAAQQDEEKAPSEAEETKSKHSDQNQDDSFLTTDPEKMSRPANQKVDSPDRSASQSQRKRRRTTTRSSRREFHASDDLMDMHEAEDLLNMVQGHLVLWPYEWLETEEQGGNWLYTIDQISPMEIYN